jgi:hypothetical protein
MSKNKEKPSIQRAKKRIKKLKIKNGKVVAFERDKDPDTDEWENSGGFYLYKVRSSKLVESSKRFIIPFPWDETYSEDDNIDKARDLAKRYTKVFNTSDLEARSGLKKDLYYLADMGLTFSESWKSAKGDLVEEGKEIGIGALKKSEVSFGDYATAKLIEKGIYKKEDVERQFQNNLAEILQMIAGEAYSQVEKAWTDQKYLKAVKELKDKKETFKKLLTELIEDWCAIYGPAIVTVRTKLKKGAIIKEEVPEELDKEIRLNRIAARGMSLIMKLGCVVNFQINRTKIIRLN